MLLNVTWRMHPDVCEFISNVMYEGRLTSDVTCVGQSTAEGTGLRWTRAEHTGNSTEAPEEAHLVASTIKGLLGTDWTDQHRVTRPLAVSDMIVVTPYNDQRRLDHHDHRVRPGNRWGKSRDGRQVPGSRGRCRLLFDGAHARRLTSDLPRLRMCLASPRRSLRSQLRKRR